MDADCSGDILTLLFLISTVLWCPRRSSCTTLSIKAPQPSRPPGARCRMHARRLPLFVHMPDWHVNNDRTIQHNTLLSLAQRNRTIQHNQLLSLAQRNRTIQHDKLLSLAQRNRTSQHNQSLSLVQRNRTMQHNQVLSLAQRNKTIQPNTLFSLAQRKQITD